NDKLLKRLASVEAEITSISNDLTDGGLGSLVESGPGLIDAICTRLTRLKTTLLIKQSAARETPSMPTDDAADYECEDDDFEYTVEVVHEKPDDPEVEEALGELAERHGGA